MFGSSTIYEKAYTLMVTLIRSTAIPLAAALDSSSAPSYEKTAGRVPFASEYG
jgi:hypothetical protein